MTCLGAVILSFKKGELFHFNTISDGVLYTLFKLEVWTI